MKKRDGDETDEFYFRFQLRNGESSISQPMTGYSWAYVLFLT